MSKARDLIKSNLYPFLATFSVIYFSVQIAPIAHKARHYNRCVEGLIASYESKGQKYEHHHIGWGHFTPEAICNGGS